MDDPNIEGMLGTENGDVYYLNFDERIIIKLISRVSPALSKIDVVKYDTSPKQTVFMSSCGRDSGDVKIYTAMMID